VTLDGQPGPVPRQPIFLTKSEWPYEPEWAYEGGGKMVLEGELKPGAALDREELARELKISATRLREALRPGEEGSWLTPRSSSR
jgi:hypothetical protein